MMKYLVLGGAIAMGAFSFVNMASISGGSSFDYAKATMEERKVWMEGEASTLKKVAKFALPSGRGPSALNMRLKNVETNPMRREMKMNIAVKVPYGKTVSSLPEREFQKAFCKNFVKTAIYRNEVSLIASFKDQKKRELAWVKVNKRTCDRFKSSS